MIQQAVLIIEDDPDWQHSFTEIISDTGFCPIVVSTYQAALAALAAQNFALAVVDISLAFKDHSDKGGVEILREMVKLPVRLPAIVVTGYASVELAIETLAELNAVHFFRKEEFRRRDFSQVVKREALAPDTLQNLSDREREVLQLMCTGQTNQEIADKLVVSVNTVKKHVQSIFTKLNVNSRAAAVAKALEQDR